MSEPSGEGANTPGGGRTLGGGAAEPLPASWANRQSQPRVGRIGGPPTTASNRSGGSGRIATLSDMRSQMPSMPPRGGMPGFPPPGGDDSDEEEHQSFFAGGERSGLSVQGPSRRDPQLPSHAQHVQDIVRRAAEGSRRRFEEEEARSGPFHGAGNRLGDEETPSTTIPDPNVAAGRELETAIRVITFWKNGFTIEDGPLLTYDNPQNAQLLELINSGHAPPQQLNVQVGQPVELRIAHRVAEEYAPPPPGPFAGQGNRLGSPVPTSSASQPTPGSSTSPLVAYPSTSSGPTAFQVDLDRPTTSIQIRLADGTRLVCRMNMDHTIGDIRNFLNAARPGNATVPYVIQTPLPVKILSDESQTIEAAGLKNAVVVQRNL